MKRRTQAVLLLNMLNIEEDEEAYNFITNYHITKRRRKNQEVVKLVTETSCKLFSSQVTQAAVFLEYFKEKHVRPKHYFEHIIPSYSFTDFKSHFRLERSTFEVLLETLGQSGLIDKPYIGGREPLPIPKMALIAIWYLANEESMRGIADRLGILNYNKYILLQLTLSSSPVVINVYQ